VNGVGMRCHVLTAAVCDWLNEQQGEQVDTVVVDSLLAISIVHYEFSQTGAAGRLQ